MHVDMWRFFVDLQGVCPFHVVLKVANPGQLRRYSSGVAILVLLVCIHLVLG